MTQVFHIPYIKLSIFTLLYISLSLIFANTPEADKLRKNLLQCSYFLPFFNADELFDWDNIRESFSHLFNRFRAKRTILHWNTYKFESMFIHNISKVKCQLRKALFRCYPPTFRKKPFQLRRSSGASPSSPST